MLAASDEMLKERKTAKHMNVVCTFIKGFATSIKWSGVSMRDGKTLR